VLLFELRHRETPATETAVVAPPPVVAPTFLEISASPWARVLQLQDGEGRSLQLPDDGATPFRLDGLKAGQYKVTFTGPNGDRQIANCSISTNDHLCMLQSEAPDIEQVLTGVNP
jgi:hypothetical protein